MLNTSDTIVAIATPPGEGAIGVIRLSGPQAVDIVNKHFTGKDLAAQPTHTLHFGRIKAGNTIVDEVVASLYRAPKSYTGDDVVEVSCHGSGYVLQQLLQLFIGAGARMAKPGEFTLRAFLKGKLDLTQAEAVADLIASHSSIAHKAAMHNLRGGFSHDLKAMREELIKFSALIELELDFSQEDVEFADRTQLYNLLKQLTITTQQLLDSFRLGNVIKNGVSVAIVGKPNAGKSTLLNALLNEERAIVSDIAGTTRDTIEETLNINGILFRLIDTAGIREHSSDVIELKGIERSKEAMNTAEIVIYLFDVVENLGAEMEGRDGDVRHKQQELEASGYKYLLVGNKLDEVEPEHAADVFKDLGDHVQFISAKNKENIHALKQALYDLVAGGSIQHEGTIITNARHHAALQDVLSAVTDIKTGMNNNLPGDLVSLDIRRALHYLGEITGEVTTEDKLDYIFSKFCIGK